MKGIILAGGLATRLYPLTATLSKHLLPIYNKPMIFYPLSVLMLAHIRDILIISTTRDIPAFQSLLGDGSKIGIRLSYAIQDKPNGIAEAFILGEGFIKGDGVTLILGDNIFYGQGLSHFLSKATHRENGATIFAHQVNDPERFGVVECDLEGKVISIEEKPKVPKSNYAVTGLYVYDKQIAQIAKTIQPSPRGELEITDINKVYLAQNQLNVEILGRGFAWFDTGTFDSLIETSAFIQTIEKKQRLKIACLEEIAYHNHWIDKEKLNTVVPSIYQSTEYGLYLKTITL